MKRPIYKTLSKSMVEAIDFDKVIYADVSGPEALLNAGGLSLYIPQIKTIDLICYQTGIQEDKELFLFVSEQLYFHSESKGRDEQNENFYYKCYYGGWGSKVWFNKKVHFTMQGIFLICKTDEWQFKIPLYFLGIYTELPELWRDGGLIFNYDTKRISPKWIEKLEPNEVFVFGSNLKGLHGSGAALAARKWGAVLGQGVGLHGQTYAIPTMLADLDSVKPYVAEFLSFAKSNNNLKFLVTEIGCGIAGFSVVEIAPLFESAIDENIENIFLPESFYDVLWYDKTSDDY
jgi:hypothetical protein